MNYSRQLLFGFCLMLVLLDVLAFNEKEIVIGSKNFTENIIVAEIATQLIRETGINVSHRSGLGGSRILWSALHAGEIAAYPEYTGTLKKEILSDKNIDTFAQLKAVLKGEGIGITPVLGFNNTYIIGMLETVAGALDVNTISDLKRHPELTFAFSNEFMDRGDGWPGLQAHYQLPQVEVSGLDHDLAYRALSSGAIDAMDLYSTDAEIQYYKIRSLIDDQHYFPDYHAVYLYRLDQSKAFVNQLRMISGQIDDASMLAMNAAVKLDGESEKAVSSAFIMQRFDIESQFVATTVFNRFLKNTKDHLALVAVSLLFAILIAIPLGIIAARRPGSGRVILTITAILQTIPSLALFVFMIPLLGIGGPPTRFALFIYSLLPIVRNTYSGLHDIPAALRESAQVIGLPSAASLRLVELPLATRSIFAGIKTSAVINVGTATLGALIGAGGYGQPIISGIRLDDIGLILQGAIPAAVLALLVQGMFELFERLILPEPLRYQLENRKG
ncbi:MAG: osmoprotectant transport system permease protein [Gammaproteobacteria bacterium]|jgi:osmoprotectant transport system permease protein